MELTGVTSLLVILSKPRLSLQLVNCIGICLCLSLTLSSAYMAERAFSQSTMHLVSYEGDCGKTLFLKQSGYIASSGFSGGRYPTGVNCTYDINLKRGSRIKLTWLTFDVDGNMPDCAGNGEDYIEVYVGNAAKAKPHDIYTEDNCLRIKFVSSTMTIGKDNKGFMAAYSSMNASDPVSSMETCNRQKDLTAKSGVLHSPFWPVTYRKMMKGICSWNIDVNEADVIQLNFMSVDTFGWKGYCQSRSSDIIDVKGKESDYTTSDFERTICGRHQPFSIRTQFSELDVLFQKNERLVFKNKGFIVGYIAYTPGNDDSVFPPWKIGLIAFVVCFITICCICCLLRFKKKQKHRRSRRLLSNRQNQNTNRSGGARPRTTRSSDRRSNIAANQRQRSDEQVTENQRNSEERQRNDTRSHDTLSNTASRNTQRPNGIRSRDAATGTSSRTSQRSLSRDRGSGHSTSPTRNTVRCNRTTGENLSNVTNRYSPAQDQQYSRNQTVTFHAEAHSSPPRPFVTHTHPGPIDRTVTYRSGEFTNRTEGNQAPPPYSFTDPFPTPRQNAIPNAPPYPRNEIYDNYDDPSRNFSNHLPSYSPTLSYLNDNLPHSNHVYDNPGLSSPDTRQQNQNNADWNAPRYDNPVNWRTTRMNNLPTQQNLDHPSLRNNESYEPILYDNLDRLDAAVGNLPQSSGMGPEDVNDERTPLVSQGTRK